jgi:hypothetical protein
MQPPRIKLQAEQAGLLLLVISLADFLFRAEDEACTFL